MSLARQIYPALSEWAYDDRELVEAYRADELPARTIKTVRDHLWAYAFVTLSAAVKNGTIFGRCGELGRPLLMNDRDRQVLATDVEARDELIVEVLAEVDAYFWKRSMRDRWNGNHAGGAAGIPTYFAGLCFMSFAGACERWSKHRSDLHADAVGHGEAAYLERINKTELLFSSEVDPESTALARDSLAAIGELATAEQRAILAVLANDSTAAEVAAELQLTVRQVETRMRALRLRVKRAVRHGDIAVPPGIRPSTLAARRLGSVAA